MVREGSSRRQLLRTAGAAGLAAFGATTVLADPASATELTAILAPIGPVRVYDTRLEGGRMLVDEQRTLVGTAEPDELAHLYNVTVTETDGSAGFLALFPGDVEWPGTSSVNWFGPGQTLANSAYTKLGGTEQLIRLRTGGPAGSSTHVVLDLMAVLIIIDLDEPPSAALTALAGGCDRQDRRLRSVASD
jgi:hypothetical protein